jgi:hypothetical protein
MMQKLKSPAIRAAAEVVHAAHKKLRETIYRSVTRCQHAQIGECDYKPMTYMDSLPPMSVCLNCGLTETGWGCGYVVLRGARVRMERDEVYALRTVDIREDDKGPLLRKETSVHRLVRHKLGLKKAPGPA